MTTAVATLIVAAALPRTRTLPQRSGYKKVENQSSVMTVAVSLPGSGLGRSTPRHHPSLRHKGAPNRTLRNVLRLNLCVVIILPSLRNRRKTPRVEMKKKAHAPPLWFSGWRRNYQIRVNKSPIYVFYVQTCYIRHHGRGAFVIEAFYVNTLPVLAVIGPWGLLSRGGNNNRFLRCIAILSRTIPSQRRKIYNLKQM